MAITQRNESHSTWSIDPSKTRAEFSVKVFGVQTVRGRFHEVIGTVDGDEDDPTTALAEVTINAASIDTKLKMRDRHLRTADFLDVEHYPTITFKSTHVEQIGKDLLLVTGDLTMHGVTHVVELDVRIDRRHQEWAVMTASTTIDRRAFGVTWNRLGAIGSVVAVRFQITLRRDLSPRGAVAGGWAR